MAVDEGREVVYTSLANGDKAKLEVRARRLGLTLAAYVRMLVLRDLELDKEN